MFVDRGRSEVASDNPTADVGCLAASSVWTAVRATASCGRSRYAASPSKPRNCSA
jgi:hypothetical protein